MRAEFIDGPANIRLGPKEAILLSLYDRVLVDCAPMKDNWYKIAISIKLTAEQYDQEYPIKAGDKLFNWNDEIIGEALIDIPNSVSSTGYSGGAPGIPRRYRMDVFGYTFKSNIRDTSIPEIQLSMLLLEPSENNFEKFEKYLSKFEFRPTKLLNKLYPQVEEYYVLESIVQDPSPMDRIRLIFIAQSLVAVVHTRTIKSSSASNHDLVRGRTLSIYGLPNNIDERDFIEKNKRAYDGVD